MKPRFLTLILLTLLTAALLLPFALSPTYIPALREHAFELLEASRADLYKLITGFIALAFVLFEMILTARKRGRRWKLKIPGSMLLWRSLHIFLGVGLIATVLIHTIGSNSSNYNAVFLWIFFAVSLSALIGVVAETGILESAQTSFNFIPESWGPLHKMLPSINKGPLIRGLRSIWLSSHIILVSIFIVMLAFHIFLAFYFQ